MRKSLSALFIVLAVAACQHSDASPAASSSQPNANMASAANSGSPSSNTGGVSAPPLTSAGATLAGRSGANPTPVGPAQGAAGFVAPSATGGSGPGAGVAGDGALAGAGSDRAAQSGAGGSVMPEPAGAGGSGSAGMAALGGSGGGMSNGGGGEPDQRPYPPIQFAGLVSAVELAPVRVAAAGIYPARVTIGSGGVDALFGIGGALVASNAETQALRASVQHPNLRIVFTICEGLYRIVAKRSAGIATLADLKGKRIALPSGTSSNYFLTKMLPLAGLSERDVTIVSQSPGRGQLLADAATIWEPGIQYVADNLKDDAIEFQKDDQGREVYRELFNLHATAESLSDPDKRRAIVQFVHALMVASEQVRNDPAPAIKLLTTPTGASADVLGRSLQYERYAGGLVADLLDVLEEEEGWRARIDGRSARSRSELSMLIDDSVVRDAASM